MTVSQSHRAPAVRMLLCAALVCVALSAVSVQRASGQVLISLFLGDKVSSEKFHLGLNVGANFSNLSGIDSTDVRAGFMLGIIGEWRFAGDFYLQPEIVPFCYVGAKNLPPSGLDLPEIEEELADKKHDRRLNYFAIPVLVKYATLNRRLHIGAGPQVGFLTSATDKYSGVIENTITIEEDIKDRLNSTDAGPVFQLEYKLKNDPFSTSISARYYHGLTDIIKDNPENAVYNRVFSLFISVPIGKAHDPEGDQ